MYHKGTSYENFDKMYVFSGRYCKHGNVFCSIARKFIDHVSNCYNGADKSLTRPRRKQTTTTEDFEFHISYL